jgi:hypothetical protein
LKWLDNAGGCFGLAAVALTAVAAAPAADPRPLPRPAPAGEVCGEAGLLGVALPPVDGEGACGIAAPVRLEAAAGVAVEPPATVECGTARALAEWLEAGPVAGFAALGERVEAVTVIDAYSCRPRNREAGEKLSEHAFGRAIDVSGFRLGDGTVVTVAGDWRGSRWGPVLRRIHAAACGRFGTVLGPEANPLHGDHLHLDVAERGSGPYCR